MGSLFYLDIFTLYFEIFGKLMATPYEWNKKTHKLSLMKKKLHIAVWFMIGVILSPALVFYSTGRLLQELFSPVSTFKVYELIIYMLYYLCYVCALVFNWNIFWKGELLADSLNLLVDFDIKWTKIFGDVKQNSKYRSQREALEKLVMKLLIPTIVMILVSLVAMSLMVNFDPVQRLIFDHFPKYSTNFLVRMVGATVILLIGINGWSQIVWGLLAGVSYLSRATFWLRVISDGVIRLKDNESRGMSPLVYIRVYTIMYIITERLNDIIVVLGPALMSIAGLVHIMSIYSTIRLYTVIPMPAYGLMPIFAVSFAVMEFIILPQGAKIYEKAIDFKQTLKESENILLLKVEKGLRPVFCRVGIFFPLQLQTTFTFMKAIVDKSIDLILTV